MPQRTLQEKRTYMKQWREKRIQAGLCACCGQPNPTETRLCESCRKIRNSWPSRQHEVLNAQFARARAGLGDQHAALLQRYRLEAKLKIIEMFGGRCIVCGERNPLVLTLNHIHGYVGVNPKNGSRRGWPLYMKIINGEESADKYDLRCYNCQIVYEFQRGKIFSRIQDEVEAAAEKAGAKLASVVTQSGLAGTGTGTSSVDLQLLGGPVADGTRAELLLGEAYVRNLLQPFVEFDSGHLLLGAFRDS